MAPFSEIHLAATFWQRPVYVVQHTYTPTRKPLFLTLFSTRSGVTRVVSQSRRAWQFGATRADTASVQRTVLCGKSSQLWPLQRATTLDVRPTIAPHRRKSQFLSR